MIARYPLLWSGRDDLNDWIESHARRIRQSVLAACSWQLDRIDRHLRQLSPSDPEYEDAVWQRELTWDAIQEWAEEDVDAFLRFESGVPQRAYHARREWAAVCVQRRASHWLYKPPSGPMFRKGMQSLVGSLVV